jgi:hypothetical protein
MKEIQSTTVASEKENNDKTDLKNQENIVKPSTFEQLPEDLRKIWRGTLPI